jgi:hypothetical protein
MGIVGAERLVAYKLHLAKTDKVLTGKDVLDGSMTANNFLTLWSNPVDIKASLLSGTCDNVFDELKGRPTVSFTDSEAENFTKFLEVIPRDLAYPLLKRLLKEGFQVFNEYIRNPAYESRLVHISKEAKGIK